MDIQFNKKNLKTLAYLSIFFSYVSLQIGFFYDEDFVGGAKADYVTYRDWINLFIKDFSYYFFNYDDLDERHSPVIIIYFTLLNKIGLSDTIIRYIHLNIAVLIFYFFYKCLRIKLKEINKFILILFAGLIFISPTLRALAIWPDSRIYGLFFFVLSVFFFLKFQNDKKINNIYLNIFFLAISSYISPNFSLFSIFFFLNYYFFYGLSVNLTKIILLNLFLAFPAFYYLFILDIMFLLEGGTPGDAVAEGQIPNRLNFGNKFILISSMIFFYLIPFLISKVINLNKINTKQVLLALVILIPSIIIFNYQASFTGGGIFFHASQAIFNNNLLVFFVSLIALLVIINISEKNFENILLIILLIVSNVQLTIYHKYYDPLLLILFFTLFKFDLKNINLKSYFIFFIYSLAFLSLSIMS